MKLPGDAKLLLGAAAALIVLFAVWSRFSPSMGCPGGSFICVKVVKLDLPGSPGSDHNSSRKERKSAR